jgi:hypothetical protein
MTSEKVNAVSLEFEAHGSFSFGLVSACETPGEEEPREREIRCLFLMSTRKTELTPIFFLSQMVDAR